MTARVIAAVLGITAVSCGGQAPRRGARRRLRVGRGDLDGTAPRAVPGGGRPGSRPRRPGAGGPARRARRGGLPAARRGVARAPAASSPAVRSPGAPASRKRAASTCRTAPRCARAGSRRRGIELGSRIDPPHRLRDGGQPRPHEEGCVEVEQPDRVGAATGVVAEPGDARLRPGPDGAVAFEAEVPLGPVLAGVQQDAAVQVRAGGLARTVGGGDRGLASPDPPGPGSCCASGTRRRWRRDTSCGTTSRSTSSAPRRSPAGRRTRRPRVGGGGSASPRPPRCRRTCPGTGRGRNRRPSTRWHRARPGGPAWSG